jgi:hypothetical protein
MSDISLVKNIALRIATNIKKNNLVGYCHLSSMLLKEELFRHFKIEIDLVPGILEVGDNYTHHFWCEYNGKKIDVSIHRQPGELSFVSSPIILDEKSFNLKNEGLKYFKHDCLPQEYLSRIFELANKENFLKDKSRTNDEDKELELISKYLDRDGFLNVFFKKKYHSLKKIRTLLRELDKNSLDVKNKILKNIQL